ncbi:conserved hypothetical protein [Vibrio phage 199E37-1]|nr:conserved hypothetical protein [Vibrio phage 199E37-1]
MAVKQATVSQESLQWGLLPPDWPDLLKEDWQNKTNGINEVAEVANEANVTANSEVDKNKNQDKAIELNRKSINTLSENVGVLNQKTSANAQQISKNTQGVSENKQGVAANKQEIDTHTQSVSAHGATGNVVGSEDYAQELTGGVVLLASSVAELTSYSAQAAPAAYDQAEEQAFRDGVQSEINKLVAKVNEIVQGQITAKQMGTNAQIT